LFTVIVYCIVGEEWPAGSVKVRLRATLAFAVGVPETVPVFKSNARPLAGRPTTVHVRGPAKVPLTA
jgi:hypothetical protein